MGNSFYSGSTTYDRIAAADALLDQVEADLAIAAPLVASMASRTISAGSGLTGGGDLSADRSFAVDFASNAEAEAALSTVKVMNPVTVKDALLNGTFFTQDGTGAQARSFFSKLKDARSLLDFIPPSEHAAIKAYTSTTDLTTYINAAFAAVATTSGVLYCPYGLYPHASAIGRASMRNVEVIGGGGVDTMYAANTGTVFKFTGTGSGNQFTMTDHRGVWIRHVQFVYTSNSFTGTQVNCSSSFSTGNASGFENVQTYQVGNTGHTAAQCYYLKNCVDVTWRNCYVAHANYGWVGIFAGETGETNMISLINCTSIALKSAAIVNPVIGWSITRHNFELSDTSAPCGIVTSGTFDIKDLGIYFCKCADSVANGTWYSFSNSVFNLTILGGAILSSGGTTTGVLLAGTFNGVVLIKGVEFSGLTIGVNFFTATTGAEVSSCNFLSTTTPISGKSNCDAGSRFFANNPASANSVIPVSEGGTGTTSSTGTGSVVLSASPALTGNPTAPTPSAGDNDTSIATTQFVQSALDAQSVQFDGSQSLSSAQKTTARTNIGIGSPGTALVLSAYLSADQTPSANTWTKVQINTENSDPNGWYDNATNYRFQPNSAGVYLVIGQLQVEHSTYAGVAVYKNGSAYNKYVLSLGTVDASQVTVPAVVEMNGSSDYVELFGFATGASHKFINGSRLTNIDIYRLA